MANFAEFLLTFDIDANRRGRQFEQFAKWFLKNDPEWATQVADIWRWDEYPDRWGADCGIDLVFKSKLGKIWAVQAKCYAADHDISKSDVDKFLSESNRRQIDHRLLIATTDRIGTNARQVLDAQEKSVVRYLLSHFESAAIEFPSSIQSLSSGKRKPPPELDRPHQIEAVGAVLAGFQTSDRGQLIMACGTGKTFVCLWVKEALKAKRTLVLVPSLNLLSQTLSEWTFAAQEPFEALCVCSDQTVNRRDDDEAISLAADLPFPVTSDVNEIADFLRSGKDQVIFSTYQSSPLIAQAQIYPDVPRFELAIADEAHRCAGKTNTVFGTVLDDRLLKADRRLFATATPRIYRASLKKAAEEFGVEVVDMSDESRFGKRFHTLTFGEAIRRELLTDYRVVIVAVDNGRVREWIENRRLVETNNGVTTDARSLAGQIGLLKAIKDWNLCKIISFHSRVKSARVFSEDIIQIAQWLDANHRLSGTLRAEFVSGEMSAILRKQKLVRLRDINPSDIRLLSNAKCLSEGVDVPALDGVAFVDPRSSEIDIIQSVGRAIRLSQDKQMGVIVIPVFVEQTEDAEAALEASEFKPIWDVLEALKSHDETLSDELDQLRIELGAKRIRSVSPGQLTKIVFDLPTSINENFAESLRARLVEKTTESWMFWFGLLEAYVDEHGHSRVPGGYRTAASHNLGSWVAVQRSLKDKMPHDRRERLDALKGWSWDVLNQLWEEGFAHLKEFVDQHGHSRVPQGFRTDDGYRLGGWVNTQRGLEKRPDRRERLEALPGWTWNPRVSQWEEAFTQLKLYSERYGHCRVPFPYNTDDGVPLGRWVYTQRKATNVTARYYRDAISDDRRKRLEALPGWSWALHDENWEGAFAKLQDFVGREGHCKVRHSYKTEDGMALGSWLGRQRAAFRKGELDLDRRQRLEALPGWVWWHRSTSSRKRALADRSRTLRKQDVVWEERFKLLEKFVEQEGHSRVPPSFKTDGGYALGVWVGSLRQKKAEGLFKDHSRKQRLEALPGWSWTPQSERTAAHWEKGFEHLKFFLEQHGHSEVPGHYKTNDGFRLGRWVSRARQNTEDADRRRRLEALPHWAWSRSSARLDAIWEEHFIDLRRFVEQQGHSTVPHYFKTTDGFALGQWVSNQRAIFNLGKLALDRQRRLEALSGWMWKVGK